MQSWTGYCGPRFRFGRAFLDTSPAEAKRLKEQAGVDADYFTAIPDDLREMETRQAVEDIKRLCSRTIQQSLLHLRRPRQ